MQNFVSASMLFSGYKSSLLITETCIKRTVGRCCRNFASDPEQSIWENEPNLHILGLSMDNVGQFERITFINMQMHAYL